MSSSNSDVSRARDTSVDQAQRHGASAYIDQSEYDAYKQPSNNSTSAANRGAYSNYPTDNNKNRYVQDVVDDDFTPTTINEYSTGQQQSYAKNSSTTSYSGLYQNSFVYLF
jgi:hypothetical protein